jgi:PAS domain S-box-containing protein
MIDYKKHNTDNIAELRKRAEENALENTPVTPEDIKKLSPEEIQQTLLELRVHQIELEMQNEELRAAQTELNISATRYSDLYNFAPVGYCTVNEKGVILEINLSTATLLGKTSSELVNQEISRFILNEDKDIYYLNRKKLYETGIPQSFEFRMLKKDGTVFWAHLNMSADHNSLTAKSQDSGGKSVCHIVLSDINARKQLELELNKYRDNLEEIVEKRSSALRESEKKYRELVENTNSIILIMDKTGNVTFFNEFAQSFFGFTCEEIVGKNVMGTIVPGKDTSGQDLKEMILDIGRHPDKYRNNLNENMRKDGELVWIAWTNKPIFDDNGQVSEIMCVGNDISARVKAEKALEKYQDRLEELVEERTSELREEKENLFKSEEKYRQLHDSMTDAFILVDMSGKIMEINRSFKEMLGYSDEELLKLSYRELTPVAWHDIEKKIVNEQILKKGYSEIYEKEYLRKDGIVIPVELRTFLIRDDDGTPSRMWAIVRDITERKRLVAEKEKLEEQNQQLLKAESLGRMSGSIAHLFNNHLQVVMGYLEIVISDLPPGDFRIENLGRSMQAAKKASEVSNNLLYYLGKKQVKLESLDLAALCRKSLPLIQAGKPETVALDTALPSPGPLISADAQQIRQILDNLIVNAWESIGEGSGIVRLSVRTVSRKDIPKSRKFPIEWHPKDQTYACLEVKDTGAGISEKDMGNLFDPFFSTKFTGRGLGLPVVLGILRMHGAVATVESKVGTGSVFSVFFPLSAKTGTSKNNTV